MEIGHLIDASERAGIEGLGQVDLERRVHRNQELEGLSRMSFVILQAVMKRLEERARRALFAELGSTMKLPRSGRGRLALEVMELADNERPPMIRIPEYLEKRRGRIRGDDLSVSRGGAAHDRTVARRPGRAGLVQGLAHLRRGGARARDGWRGARPDDEVLLAPLADGGEGTLVAIEAAGGWHRREASWGRTLRRRSGPAGSPATTAARRSWRWPRRPASRC